MTRRRRWQIKSAPRATFRAVRRVARQLWIRYGRGFGRHYLRALPWIIVFTLSVHVLEHVGALVGAETVWLDTLLRQSRRQMSQDIFIVEISESDYRSLFRSTSPLDPRPVVALVRTILTASPAVVAVDLDTSDAIWCHYDVAAITPPASTVLWAQVPTATDESVAGEAETFGLAPVLGGALVDKQAMGIPVFPFDRDGSVRRYLSAIPVTGELKRCGPGSSSAKGAARSMKSLSRLVAETYRPAVAREPGGERIFNFAGDRYHFLINDARDFVNERGEALPLNDRQKQQLARKIVLIGGNFRAARDVYRTPVGPMTGIELVAYAVESDLHGGGIRELNIWLARLADLFAGSLITWVYFHWERRPRVAFRLSMLAIPLLSMSASFVAYKSYAYWFSFAPIVIGVLIHQLYEQSKLSARLEAFHEHESGN